MFCYNCGKEIDDKAVVCVGCGVPTKSEDVTSSNEQAPSTQVNVQSNVLILILSIISISLIPLGLIFFFTVAAMAIGVVFASLAAGISAFAAGFGRTCKYKALGLTAFILSIVFMAVFMLIMIIGMSVIF